MTQKINGGTSTQKCFQLNAILCDSTHEIKRQLNFCMECTKNKKCQNNCDEEFNTSTIFGQLIERDIEIN